jgi:hypothetical protein
MAAVPSARTPTGGEAHKDGVRAGTRQRELPGRLRKASPKSQTACAPFAALA